MLERLLQNEKLRELEHALQNRDSILVEHLWNASKALVISLAQKATGKNVVILTGASQEEIRLFHDFSLFSNVVILDFPAWETLPSENISPSPDIVGERYKVLKTLVDNPQPHIILTSLQACLQKLILPSAFKELYLELRKGSVVPFEEFIRKLVKMGYQRRPVAADKGEFAVRGGIIDVFPVSSPDPFRIEFWGDEIESLRIYDPVGQKTIQAVDQVEVTPAQELEFLSPSSKLATFFDYLGSDTVVVFDDLLALEDRYASLVNITGAFSHSFSTIDALLKLLTPYQKIFMSQSPIEELTEVQRLDKDKANFYSSKAPMQTLRFQMFNRELQAKRWIHPFQTIPRYLAPEDPDADQMNGEEIFTALADLSHKACHLHILCATELEESTFHKRLLDAKIVLPHQTTYHIGYLSSGFALSDIEEVFLPLTEITHRYKIRRQKQRSTYHTPPSEVYDLSAGDLVVHMNNGIGRFLGTENRPNHMGIESEFFLVEYADSAKLYVPFNQAHFLSKYIGAGEESPRLHALGSTRWKKTKEQTERAIMGYASELLDIYAKREMAGGFAYSADSDDMAAFEEDFPYVETADQLEAVASIKVDMCSSKSMDRLVCGDVGYGKTEVAMRAAFKAVVDGHKQVAVLVPTTVLAMQHYENFVERMANFPVRIGVLSRFRTSKQIKETLEGVEKGSIDILIGTHRIISQDVQFKDLGLVIIDEEQRFGVKAKEHLKKIKMGVDCLILSATPIPRTLYMSLIGARDMSVINTPPQDRLPIKTIIADSSENTIKSALLRELARDGQAFIIHNHVETIYETADRVKKMLPQARVVVGHGQMGADESDLVFHAFKNGQADILVATTIVENGIDIPNANTILIDRADRFGLADLYQLRGRVGRWNRRAYAYFLIPSQRTLPEVARKRLNALVESSGYGGGMKLAMRDLEIRGAGDILGMEQSGHVASIGFHLYCKLLKRTIKALQGKIPSTICDTKIEFYVDARLPEEYVNESSLRMEIYQRLGEALSWEEVDAIWEELQDRFGSAPKPAQWLYYFTRLRVYASRHGFTNLKLEKLSLSAEQHKGKKVIVKKMLVSQPKQPIEIETKVLSTLKKEFGLDLKPNS